MLFGKSQKDIHVLVSTGLIFIKQLKSNLYVSLTTIGSFWCYLYSNWLSQTCLT